MAHLVEARPHHLRLAAQAVRVLHAVAIGMRCADGAAAQQLAIDARRVDLAAMAAHRLDARIERRVAAEARIDRQRAGDEGRGHRALGSEQSGQRERGGDLRSVQQRQALLGCEFDGAQAVGRQRFCTGHDAAIDPRLALADQDRRHVRERRQVARRAARPLRRDARHDAGVGDAHE